MIEIFNETQFTAIMTDPGYAPENAADIANKILNEYLSLQQEVYFNKSDRITLSKLIRDGDTHAARLVDIQEMYKKELCKHDPTNKSLKPNWEVVGDA